jgi:hypothetical protein
MTPTDTSHNAGRLIELLTEQRDLYRQLRELSGRQRALISGDRPELLLNILRDRQTRVAALARLNEQLAPYRRNWNETYEALPPDTRASAAALLAEINDLLKLILRSDQEDGALLSARKSAVAASLQELSGGRRINQAYAGHAGQPDDARSADLTG